MGRAPKYAKRADGNQRDVIAALEKIGCSVYIVGRPVDLLVGFRHFNFLIECKTTETRYGREDRGTDVQNDFIKSWKGQVRKVWTPEEAVELVQRAYRDGRRAMGYLL